MENQRKGSRDAVWQSNETAEQEAVIAYCDVRHIPVVHIPNEGKRTVSYAERLKRAGMRPGFPDLFIPLAREGFHGLFVEMKYGKGKTTAEQEAWLTLLGENGYRAVVCYGCEEAIREICCYVKNERL